MFINPEIGVIILVYVDNLLIFSVQKSHINNVKVQLKKEYKIKDLGNIDHILEARLWRDKASRIVILGQFIYIRKFFEDYEMKNSHPISTIVNRYKSLKITINTEPRTKKLEY